MSISIQAGATTPPTPQASPGTESGTDAQRAYRQALKDLTRAQRQLAQDVAAMAGEDRLKADQLAVEVAQAALAAAADALAKETREAQKHRQDRSGVAAAHSAAARPVVDLYA